MITIKAFHRSTGCWACKQAIPSLEHACHALGFTDYELIDINEPTNEDRAEHYSVRSVPTIVILRDGEEYHRFCGYYHGIEKDILNKIIEVKEEEQK